MHCLNYFKWSNISCTCGSFSSFNKSIPSYIFSKKKSCWIAILCRSLIFSFLNSFFLFSKIQKSRVSINTLLDCSFWESVNIEISIFLHSICAFDLTVNGSSRVEITFWRSAPIKTGTASLVQQVSTRKVSSKREYGTHWLNTFRNSLQNSKISGSTYLISSKVKIKKLSMGWVGGVFLVNSKRRYK